MVFSTEQTESRFETGHKCLIVILALESSLSRPAQFECCYALRCAGTLFRTASIGTTRQKVCLALLVKVRLRSYS